MATTTTRQLAVMLEELRADVARLKRGAATPQLSSSSLEDGAIREHNDAGDLVGVIGKQPDGSHTHVVLDGPTPYQPTDPVCEGRALAIAVTHDGSLINPATGTVDPALAPFADHEGTEVHVGETEGFLPSPETYGGELRTRTGGTLEVAATAGVKFVRLMGRSQAGKHGPPSPSVAVTVTPLVGLEQFDQARLDLETAEAAIVVAKDRLDTAFGADASFDVAASVAAAEQAAIDAAALTAQAKADQAEADALTAAAVTAQEKADAAKAQAIADATAQAATTAQQKADAAQAAAISAANSYTATQVAAVPRPHYAIAAPTTSDTAPQFQVWLQLQSGTGKVTGIWQQTTAPSGSAWVARPIRSEAIDNLDVVKLVVQAGQISDLVAQHFAARTAAIIQARIENLTVTDGAVVNTLVAQKLAAAEAAFQKVIADNILAGNLTVQIKLLANGEIQVGAETGIHITIKGNEITVWKPGTQNPDGSFNTKTKMIILGGTTGGAFEAFDADGPLGGVKSDGSLHGPKVTAPVIMLNGQDLEARFTREGSKVLARGSNVLTHSAYPGETALVGLPVALLPRKQLVRVSIRLRARAGTAGAYLTMRLRYALNGAAVSLASPAVHTWVWGPPSAYHEIQSIELPWMFPDDYEDNTFLLTGHPSTGTMDTRDYGMEVYTSGVYPSVNAMYDAYVAPPSRPFTTSRDFAEKYTYSQSGLNTSFSPSLVRAGTGGNSIYRTYLLIPEASRLDIVNSLTTPTVRVFLQYATDNYPVEPYIGTSTVSTLGGANDDGATIASSALAGYDWTGPGDGEWVTLTATQVGDIRTRGAKWVVVGRKVGSTLISFYGVNATTIGYRPEIEVSGMK